jgi:hypothetical protein
MTDADTGLVERDEQVTIVSINRLRCGNAVEGFARKPAWPRAFAPRGFHRGTGFKKTLSSRVAIVYHLRVFRG